LEQTNMAARAKDYMLSTTIQANTAMAAAVTIADWALGLIHVNIPVAVISAMFVLLNLWRRSKIRGPLGKEPREDRNEQM
jgi:hypothetical protein